MESGSLFGESTNVLLTWFFLKPKRPGLLVVTGVVVLELEEAGGGVFLTKDSTESGEGFVAQEPGNEIF